MSAQLALFETEELSTPMVTWVGKTPKTSAAQKLVDSSQSKGKYAAKNRPSYLRLVSQLPEKTSNSAKVDSTKWKRLYGSDWEAVTKRPLRSGRENQNANPAPESSAVGQESGNDQVSVAFLSLPSEVQLPVFKRQPKNYRKAKVGPALPTGQPANRADQLASVTPVQQAREVDLPTDQKEAPAGQPAQLPATLLTSWADTLSSSTTLAAKRSQLKTALAAIAALALFGFGAYTYVADDISQANQQPQVQAQLVNR